ncbi:MAG TPA: polyphosphate kinase 1 [Thermoleophilaceae bacterium]|nr:polyphosphate kinase 1 [Thermoleophilaceae bacterium]
MTTVPITPVPDAPVAGPLPYANRELSWLDFNERVLELAEDPEVPLLERAKFLAIFGTNLDEFFMVRVAGVHDQIEAGVVDARRPDGLTPVETLRAVSGRARELMLRHARHWEEAVKPELGRHDIRVIDCEQCSPAELEEVDRYFHDQIFPALTPLGVGPGRPFPYISNLSLSLAVLLRDPVTGTDGFARVKVPKEVMPRFLEIGTNMFIPLETVIARHLDALFPGMEILHSSVFRVTRDADFTVSDEADDLLRAVEDELRQRRFGEVVRLEVGADMRPDVRQNLIDWLKVDEEDVFDIDGMLDLGDLWELHEIDGHRDLRDPPFTPVVPAPFQGEEGEPADILTAMRHQDLLVHYPYDSFAATVERMVSQAVDDPAVLAIKMTVYRTSPDSSLIPSLITAAERGKQAVCMVEVKARFDERRNIGWARALEEAGAHVVHGLPGLKTHAKALLIVRREGNGVRHYVQIGTGNYNAKTARIYEDFGLFTTDPDIAADVAEVFNLLTGYSRPDSFRKALIAPTHLRKGMLEEIETTIDAQERGEETLIRMKMNQLTDPGMIEALYRASQAGVKVELNVRGICCLIPGLEDVSENISVVSVVGRFLEHSRIYLFKRGDERRILIGSADLMGRNLNNRVELVIPVEDPAAQAELADTLERCLADDTFAWDLHSDGMWKRRDGRTRSVHAELMERALTRVRPAETPVRATESRAGP